ncbi:MAG TPA: CBS domain-containing protein [Gammaproteobacteria bacterium]|nr:CBS domain-containing protein [Gammaproteobacteria bacterium]
MFTVADVMSSQPYTLSADASLGDAIRLMSEKHIRHIPLVDADFRLEGVISHRDLLAATGSRLNAAAQTSRFEDRKIHEIMTTKVATTTRMTRLRAAALYMEQHKYGCLPVVDDHQLVGIITDSDFLAVAINLLEQLDLAEPEEVL